MTRKIDSGDSGALPKRDAQAVNESRELFRRKETKMPTKTTSSNQRKMLRAYGDNHLLAEHGQPLSENQALALAIQSLAIAMKTAARDLLEAAKTNRGH